MGRNRLDIIGLKNEHVGEGKNMGTVKDLLICNIDSIGPGQRLLWFFNQEFPRLAADVADGIISTHILLAKNKYRVIVIIATAKLIVGATHIAIKLKHYGYAPCCLFIYHPGPDSKDAHQTLVSEFSKGGEAELLAAAKIAAGRDFECRWVTKDETTVAETDVT